MLRQEEGQITVFLSLIFFVLLGLTLCVLEGMYSFMESSLAEDSMRSAGNYVLANYNRNLFDRYHIFFLDPRERGLIESDGKEYLSMCPGKESFFRYSCDSLEVTEEKTAVDEDGLYLKHQIREWMKYREVTKAGEELKKLFSSASDTGTGTSLARADMNKAEAAIEESEKAKTSDTANAGDSDGNNSSGKSGESGGSQNVQTGGKTGVKWEELKSLLTNITQAGILVYAADDVGAISKLSISTDGLPSGLQSAENDMVDYFTGVLSFLKVDEWKKMLGEIRMEEWNGTALTDEFYLLEYIEENFRNYMDDNGNGTAQSSRMAEGKRTDSGNALLYEVEYLIAGKESDMDNLKTVADRILCFRFLSNYIYLSQDARWKTVSGSAAAALTGILGFPQARKAVQVLLTAAVTFGESMLDIHALLAGDEVPIIKDASTWNLTLENAATLLRNKGPVKQGRVNADYADYLKLLLSARMQRNRILFRMMDIMQLNTALEEPGFLMEECLFAFRWESEFSCGGWFDFFPGTGQNSLGGFTVKLDRLNSY